MAKTEGIEMSEGKYVEEVYRRVCAMESDGTNALADVMKVANDVAREHPLQYERFRIWSACVIVWRMAMGDIRNTLKFLSDERRRARSNRIAYWMLVGSLVLATGGIACLIYYVVNL